MAPQTNTDRNPETAPTLSRIRTTWTYVEGYGVVRLRFDLHTRLVYDPSINDMAMSHAIFDPPLVEYAAFDFRAQASSARLHHVYTPWQQTTPERGPFRGMTDLTVRHELNANGELVGHLTASRTQLDGPGRQGLANFDRTTLPTEADLWANGRPCLIYNDEEGILAAEQRVTSAVGQGPSTNDDGSGASKDAASHVGNVAKPSFAEADDEDPLPVAADPNKAINQAAAPEDGSSITMDFETAPNSQVSDSSATMDFETAPNSQVSDSSATMDFVTAPNSPQASDSSATLDFETAPNSQASDNSAAMDFVTAPNSPQASDSSATMDFETEPNSQGVGIISATMAAEPASMTSASAADGGSAAAASDVQPLSALLRDFAAYTKEVESSLTDMGPPGHDQGSSVGVTFEKNYQGSNSVE